LGVWSREAIPIQEGGEVTQQTPARQPTVFDPETAVALELHETGGPYEGERPIVAAIEPSTAHIAADTAARLARELDVPLVFIYVRERPPAILGSPQYQRRLTEDLVRGRKTLDTALAAASRHGVMSYGEILEGNAATRIVEFARARQAQLLIVGQRRRRFRPSVFRRVIRASEQPVVVAVKAADRVAWPWFPRRRGRLIKTQGQIASNAVPRMSSQAPMGEVVGLRPA
jgi:nucleotide-binding universal stress UspA family protein